MGTLSLSFVRRVFGNQKRLTKSVAILNFIVRASIILKKDADIVINFFLNYETNLKGIYKIK